MWNENRSRGFELFLAGMTVCDIQEMAGIGCLKRMVSDSGNCATVIRRVKRSNGEAAQVVDVVRPATGASL